MGCSQEQSHECVQISFAALSWADRFFLTLANLCDVGFGAGSPVTYDYGTHDNEFSGEVNWVEIDIGKDAINLDHLITAHDRLRVAMARQ